MNLVFGLAAGFGALRVAGLFGAFAGLDDIWLQVFKDAAHLFVGGVVGAAVLGRRFGVGPTRGLVWTAVALSVLELICAVLQRTVLTGS